MKYIFCSVFVFITGCEQTTNSNTALFSYQIDDFDGSGFYIFPNGVYAQYNATQPSTSYNPDSILTVVKKNSTDIREAWDIQYQYIGRTYPATLLYLRLRDSTQYIDTAYFHLTAKPFVSAKAVIKHYYFN